ncbi:MAG: transcription elongation factor GreA [Candidatus Omnitrophica bacterium]|nr:transcription elongation factor GreA [Candidatus Omnitrophota bacterium]
MAEKKISLTREGYNKLLAELEVVKGEKRRQIAKDLSEARAQGDISENAEYDAAKEAQAHNEKRIADLEAILSNATIIDNVSGPRSEVVIGATVSIKDEGSGEEFDYMLVSEAESAFEANKISATSPVGRSLMGRKVGDTVEIQVPRGTLTYRIKAIN